jgi:GH25 family lysozyme M1 (1,4-beta-N-acetylmuramidase)
MIQGLDVSHHQTRPELVPWEGCAFGCVRITWGVEGVDDLADEHMRHARAKGVELLIAYHYLKDQPGDEQARHFHRRRVSLEVEFGPLGSANDLEDMPDQPPWDPVVYRACSTSFLVAHRTIIQRPLLIYTNTRDALRYAAGPGIEREPLWLADWTPPYPAPAPWSKVTLLQYKGGGLKGFDRNRFDGSIEELRALVLPDQASPYDSLGPVVTSIHAARGQGPGGVEDFVTGPGEGVIDDGG